MLPISLISQDVDSGRLAVPSGPGNVVPLLTLAIPPIQSSGQINHRSQARLWVKSTPIKGGIQDADTVIGCHVLKDAIAAATRINPDQYQRVYKRFKGVEVCDVYR